MKSKLLRIIPLVLLFSTLQWSCANEIDVIGEWKEIPVVYGIFTTFPQGTTNYFRIEKAFLDPNTDAYEIAQRPDSLYYGGNDLEVILYERVNASGYPESFEPIDTLERVDVSTLNLPRDQGIFASSPNYIYVSTVNSPVTNADERYRYYKLVIHNKVSGKTFTQRCIGLKPGNFDNTEESFPDFKVINPARSKPVRWAHKDPISGDWIQDDVRFNWLRPYNGSIYDLSITIKYFEYEVDVNQPGEPEIPGTRVLKEIVWKPARNVVAEGFVENVERFGEYFYQFTEQNGGGVAQEINGSNFYNFLKTNLSEATGTNIRRCLNQTFDIRVDAAGPELSEYIRARNANQNLLGGLFPSDPFSNVEDGFGIFCHKLYVTKLDMNWDADVFEYMRFGEITQNLGFESVGCN